jgi:hypothetical protein
MAVGLALLMGAVAFLLLRSIRGTASLRTDRAQRMSLLADALGLECRSGSDEQGLEDVRTWPLLRGLQPGQVWHEVSDGRREPGFMIVDYFCPRSSRVPGEGALYLVAMVRLPMAVAPERVYVCQEDWFGGPVGVRGLYRIHFEDDSEFTSRFLVGGRPAHAVRAMLSPPVRRAIRAWRADGPLPAIGAEGDRLVVRMECGAGDRELMNRGVRLAGYALGIAQALAESDRLRGTAGTIQEPEPGDV